MSRFQVRRPNCWPMPPPPPPEHISTPPTEGIGNSRREGRGGGAQGQKNFKGKYEGKFEYSEAWGVLEKIISLGEAWDYVAAIPL